jgi:hypothetical protein
MRRKVYSGVDGSTEPLGFMPWRISLAEYSRANVWSPISARCT